MRARGLGTAGKDPPAWTRRPAYSRVGALGPWLFHYARLLGRLEVEETPVDLRLLRTQQTQKSFSVTAEPAPRREPASRNSSARCLAGFATRSIGILPRDLPQCCVHPSSCSSRVGQHRCPQTWLQPCANLRGDFRRDVLLTQRLERLDDESAFRESEARLFQGRVVENKSSAPNFVRAARPIGQVDCTRGHLRGGAEQIQCDGAARLDCPAEFARARLRHLVEVGAQFRRERLTEVGLIVDPTDNPPNRTFTLQPAKRRIDSRAAPEICKVPGRKRPSPSAGMNPAKSLFLGRLVRHRRLQVQEKMACFSSGVRSWHACIHPLSAVNYLSAIAPPSPCIFNNLQFRKSVVFRVLWGANSSFVFNSLVCDNRSFCTDAVRTTIRLTRNPLFLHEFFLPRP